MIDLNKITVLPPTLTDGQKARIGKIILAQGEVEHIFRNNGSWLGGASTFLGDLERTLKDLAKVCNENMRDGEHLCRYPPTEVFA